MLPHTPSWPEQGHVCIICIKDVVPCEFLGFRSGIVEVSVLLGCDAAASLGN
jgi:hypothetical protein